MVDRRPIFLVWLLVALCACAPLSRKDENPASLYIKAMNGDADSLNQLRAKAEQGNAQAGLYLGLMYDLGEGVPKDDAEAVKWYRKAAEQGHAIAQYNLGHKYANGEGVPKDEFEAYVWFNLAAGSGDKDAAKLRDDYAKRLDRAAILRAQQRSSELFQVIEAAKPKE